MSFNFKPLILFLLLHKCYSIEFLPLRSTKNLKYVKLNLKNLEPNELNYLNSETNIHNKQNFKYQLEDYFYPVEKTIEDFDNNNYLLNNLYRKNKFINQVQNISNNTSTSDVGEFSYDNQNEWPGECQNKYNYQSPISLRTIESQMNFNVKLQFGINYSKTLYNLELKNTGHTAEFIIPKEVDQVFITGPALDYEIYKINSVHFHWGSNNSVGSEHTIDGRRYPLEMHFVHYNTKYESLQEALNYEDGVTVLGVVFKVHKKNLDMQPLIEKLSEIRCKGQKSNLKKINLYRLLPAHVKQLYQYYGSLTTPPCTSNINWFVFKTPNFISSEQLEYFRKLTTDVSCNNLNLRNWRNLQPTKFRLVNRSFRH